MDLLRPMAKAPTADLAAERPQTVAVKRVVALMNAGAGAFNQTLAAEVEHTLVEAFAGLGVAADIRFVDGEGLHAAAERALAQRKTRRDRRHRRRRRRRQRTHRWPACLPEQRVPLGVLPLGTLNHFAKDLGIPLGGRGGGGDDRRWPHARSSTSPRSTARPSSTIPRSASILTWSSIANGGGPNTSSPNGWRWCRRSSACCGIFRGGGCASRPRASRGLTARPACSSATTNTAWSFHLRPAPAPRYAASSGSMW